MAARPNGETFFFECWRLFYCAVRITFMTNVLNVSTTMAPGRDLAIACTSTGSVANFSDFPRYTSGLCMVE
ncbi:hypothetical protein [Agrobacterium tumefaciens]|uniref:hypothetical protein n=1 Tax=Agrobacterium tumefaciens TaxID=358 RepID=UPI001571CAE6|nr:hypothetical protein [Agrobacterium tumefaciens]NSX93130.1 hypothetical protein [Agrobacterium tumefaciens]